MIENGRTNIASYPVGWVKGLILGRLMRSLEDCRRRHGSALGSPKANFLSSADRRRSARFSGLRW